MNNLPIFFHETPDFPLLGVGRSATSLNPLAPEPPVTERTDPRPSYRSVLTHTLSADLCRVKTSFKPFQNEHNSVMGVGEIGKKHVTSTYKFPLKSCSTTHLPSFSPNPKILEAFRKTFPTKMRPTKCPAREKKGTQEKR